MTPSHTVTLTHEGVLPEVVEWLWQRNVAVYSGDCIEQRPTSYERISMPLHQIGLARMGLWILDCPDLEVLAAACRRNGRSDFLLIVAPLKVPGGTASAVNPLDITLAQTQLASAKAQSSDLRIARAQFEHEIATLTGRAPVDVTVGVSRIDVPPRRFR